MKVDGPLFVSLIVIIFALVAGLVEHEIRIIELETKLNSKLEICTGHKRIADKRFVPINCYLVVNNE